MGPQIQRNKNPNVISSFWHMPTGMGWVWQRSIFDLCKVLPSNSFYRDHILNWARTRGPATLALPTQAKTQRAISPPALWQGWRPALKMLHSSSHLLQQAWPMIKDHGSCHSATSGGQLVPWPGFSAWRAIDNLAATSSHLSCVGSHGAGVSNWDA